MTLLTVYEVRCDTCGARAVFEHAAKPPVGWRLARRGYVRKPWHDTCAACLEVQAG